MKNNLKVSRSSKMVKAVGNNYFASSIINFSLVTDAKNYSIYNPSNCLLCNKQGINRLRLNYKGQEIYEAACLKLGCPKLW